MREKELDPIIHLLSSTNTLFIKGGKGYGKTYLLRSLEKVLPRAVYFEMGSLMDLIRKLNRRFKVKERSILGSIRELNKKKFILLLDNYEMYDYRFRRFVSKLNCQKVIATSGKTYGPTYHLKPLSFKEIRSLLGDLEEDVARGVYNVAGPNLKQVMELREKLVGKDKEEAVELLTKYKPNVERVNILRVSHALNLAYFLVILKYVLYLTNKFREGFIIAISGYSLLLLSRMFRK